MSLTREDIRGIANLARLSLTPEEEIRYAEELSVVLSYIDTLNEVDTEGVEPTTQVGGLIDIVREDVAKHSDDETRKKIVALFPHSEKNMLSVPRVFEDQ
ncbi:MAG TPA: Asp-tRNA(Asn)/Glu-tRNA(Gln) amidotransferase subunit GatC [Candidatus Magasanikbacteria bacterium]|nr:Asp-tRNA(Asn)/Glu-tRNA(Gln) amidotransferase subunit GatC [Candidatus Magasanikbacteria bacterium]